MVSKSIIGAACTCLAVLSFNADAAIVSVDWLTAGDNLITQDTESGLEWLDLSETMNRSYNDISSKLGVGEEFYGWRYASISELSGFFDAFGGDSNYYSGWSTQNNGLFDAIAPFWGDLYCIETGCQPSEGFSNVITSEDAVTWDAHYYTHINDNVNSGASLDKDLVSLNFGTWSDTSPNMRVASALVRDVSTVPVPAAAWLFGSGLLGLIGVARRKKA